ncbi:hypothetical protein J3F84DRAFT_382949 [Trichoderma pleuroticola]
MDSSWIRHLYVCHLMSHLALLSCICIHVTFFSLSGGPVGPSFQVTFPLPSLTNTLLLLYRHRRELRDVLVGLPTPLAVIGAACRKGNQGSPPSARREKLVEDG